MQTQGTIIGRRTAGAKARRGLATVTIAPGLTFFNTNYHELNTNCSLMINYMAIHGDYMFKIKNTNDRELNTNCSYNINEKFMSNYMELRALLA